jgi:hypothetical protein
MERNRHPVYHLNIPPSMEPGLSGSSDQIRHGTRVTILDNGEIYVPTLMPQPSSENPNGRALVFRKGRTEFLTGLGQQGRSYVPVDTTMEVTSQCGGTGEVRHGELIATSLLTQRSTPRPALVRRNASPEEEVPTNSYFARRTAPPRDEVPSMDYFAQTAPGTVPAPTTSFTSPEYMLANPPRQPTIRPQTSPASTANEDCLFLLDAESADFSIPPGRCKLPPLQPPIAPPIKGGPCKAGLQTNEPSSKESQNAPLDAETIDKQEAFAMLSKAFKKSQASAVHTPVAQTQALHCQEDHINYPHSPTILPPGVTEHHEPWIIERKRLHMEKLNDLHVRAERKKREAIDERENAPCVREESRAADVAPAAMATQMTREERAKRLAADIAKRLEAMSSSNTSPPKAGEDERKTDINQQGEQQPHRPWRLRISSDIHNEGGAHKDQGVGISARPSSTWASSTTRAHVPRELIDRSSVECNPRRIPVPEPVEQKRRYTPSIGILRWSPRPKDAETQTDVKGPNYCVNCVCSNCKDQRAEKMRSDIYQSRREMLESAKRAKEEYGSDESDEETRRMWEDYLRKHQPRYCRQLPVLDYDDGVLPSDSDDFVSMATRGLSDKKKDQSTIYRNPGVNELTLYTNFPPYINITSTENERDPATQYLISREEHEQHRPEYMAERKAPMFHFQGDPDVGLPPSCQPSNPAPARPTAQPQCPSGQRRPTAPLISKDIRTQQRRQQAAKFDEDRCADTKAADETDCQDELDTKSTQTMMGRALADEQPEQRQLEAICGNDPNVCCCWGKCHCKNPKLASHREGMEAAAEKEREDKQLLENIGAKSAELEKLMKDVGLSEPKNCYCLGKCNCKAAHLTGEGSRVKARAAKMNGDRKLCGQSKGYYESEEEGECRCQKFSFAVNCRRCNRPPSSDNFWTIKYSSRESNEKGQAVVDHAQGARRKGNRTVTRGYCGLAEKAPEQAAPKNTFMKSAAHSSFLDDAGYQAEHDGEDEEFVDAERVKSEDEERVWQKVEAEPKSEHCVHRNGIPGMVSDRERNMWICTEKAYDMIADEDPLGDVPNLSVDRSDGLQRNEEKKAKKSGKETEIEKLAGIVSDKERCIWLKKKSVNGSHSDDTEDSFDEIPELSVDESAELQRQRERQGEKSKAKDKILSDEVDGIQSVGDSGDSDGNFQVVYGY